MAYFFVSFEAGLREQFQKRLSFLAKAVHVKNKQHLLEVLSEKPKDPFFLVHFKGSSSDRDDQVLTIRQKCPQGKIIYLAEGKTVQDLKSHQLTPVGGDAYVDHMVKAEMLTQVLDGLKDSAEEEEEEEELIPDEKSFSDSTVLQQLKSDPTSTSIDSLFSSVIKVPEKKALWQSAVTLTEIKQQEEEEEVEVSDDAELSLDSFDEFSLNDETNENDSGEDMTDKDKELSLDDLGDLELGDDAPPEPTPVDDGLEMSMDSIELDLGDDLALPTEDDEETQNTITSELEMDDMDITLDHGDDAPIENLGELDFTSNEDKSMNLSMSKINLSKDDKSEIKLSDDLPPTADLDLGGDDEDIALDFGDSDLGELNESDSQDLSVEAREKLKEIDEILVKDATQNSISIQDVQAGEDFIMDASLDEPLVSDDLNLDSLNFGGIEDEPTRVKTKKEMAEDEPTRVRVVKAAEEEPEEVEEKPKKKKKEPVREQQRDLGNDLKEISGAYSGELERTQATISNLRADREELLAKIQKLEEDKLLHNRQSLSLRAELDEKKIELSIIRKKLNEEINDLRDRLKLFDEKRLILEEKNRYLTQELDKAGQKNKIDVKKVQMRERELEQRLELLKSDAENQIRNRDLKILELKRKVDAMEFDMESISQQEKRSVESRFELEDKLDKAIKTLRGAITVLEDESQRGNALEALKKNIDM